MNKNTALYKILSDLNDGKKTVSQTYDIVLQHFKSIDISDEEIKDMLFEDISRDSECRRAVFDIMVDQRNTQFNKMFLGAKLLRNKLSSNDSNMVDTKELHELLLQVDGIFKGWHSDEAGKHWSEYDKDIHKKVFDMALRTYDGDKSKISFTNND